MSTSRQTTTPPTGATSGPLPPTTRRAVEAMIVGLVLTLLALAAPIIDQLTTQNLAAHLHTVYAGTGVAEPAAGAIVAYLVVVGALGTLSWVLTLRAVRRRRRGARPAATGLFLLATVLAVLDLTVSEYGNEPVLPGWLGVLGLLPCVAGLVAVVLLWRTDAAPRSALTRRVS